MVSEDVGWAQPKIPGTASEILKEYEEAKKHPSVIPLNQPKFTKEIIRGVQPLAKCNKSRYIDYLYHLASDYADKNQLPSNLDELLVIIKDKQESLRNKVTATFKTRPVDPRLIRRRKPVYFLWNHLLTASPYRAIRVQVSTLLDIFLFPVGGGLLTLIHALLLVVKATRLG